MVGRADFTMVRLALCVTATVAELGGEVTAGPLGGVPLAVAESFTEPLSMSVWVVL